MDVNVDVKHEVDSGGALKAIGMIAGIGLGLVCGAAASSFVASKLPEAITTFDKIRNAAVVAGVGIATQYVVSEAVCSDISESIDLAAAAAAKTQKKLQAKQKEEKSE